MKEWLLQFTTNSGLTLAWPDRFFWVALFDILLVYYLLYRGLLLLKGTKAVRMLLGLLLVVASYFVSRQFGMQTFSFILDQFFNSFILVILIIFQDDLRRGLSRVGINPFQRGARLSEEEMAGLDEMVKAVNVLSTKKVGALIVIERAADIRDHVQEGTPIDAVISEELLFSLFLPYSPLHDGAAVLHQGRIVRAGCFLPLTQNPEISKHLGTRHRAAIGLTESTDALVVVVSETDGKISLCRDGKISRGLDPSALYNEVLAALWPRAPQLLEQKSLSPEAKAAEKKPAEKKSADKKPADPPKIPITTRVEPFKDVETQSALPTTPPTASAPNPNNSNTRLKPFKPKQETKKSFQSEIRTTTSDSGKHTDTRLKPLMITETVWNARNEDEKDSNLDASRLDEPKRSTESPVPRQEDRSSDKSDRASDPSKPTPPQQASEPPKPAAPKQIVVKRIDMEDAIDGEDRIDFNAPTKESPKTAQPSAPEPAKDPAKAQQNEKPPPKHSGSFSSFKEPSKSFVNRPTEESKPFKTTDSSAPSAQEPKNAKEAQEPKNAKEAQPSAPPVTESKSPNTTDAPTPTPQTIISKGTRSEQQRSSEAPDLSNVPTVMLGKIPQTVDSDPEFDHDLPRSPYSSAILPNPRAANTPVPSGEKAPPDPDASA
ncbi:diadenylate cyclase CdaA [Myxococcota bacterium]|nr:diadenylate cyclase CdaA [Myxococcota bacterium]